MNGAAFAFYALLISELGYPFDGYYNLPDCACPLCVRYQELCLPATQGFNNEGG